VYGKVDGLSEYDIRRPATPTGTNLLGLVKHMTMAGAWFFGKTFLWATELESRTEIVDRFQRACTHADATQPPDLPRSALPLIADLWTAVRRVIACEPDSAWHTARSLGGQSMHFVWFRCHAGSGRTRG
jgi:uncharacterized protein DUF664